jgi:exopolysaccharide biosynthesis polyprenyl glycosylphosphotransferase
VNTTKRRIYVGALKLFNLGLIVSAFAIATVLQAYHQGGDTTLAAFLSMRVKLINLVSFTLILFAWHGALSICNLNGSQRLVSRLTMIVDAARAITLATLALVAAMAVFRITMVTCEFVIVFWLCGFIFLAGGRLLVRTCLEFARLHGRNLRYIVILGTNRRAIEFARKLHANPEWGYTLLGFVDDEWHQGNDSQIDVPICCNFDNLPDFLRLNAVDEVANYLPLRSFYQHSSEIVSLCEHYGILMRFDPAIFDLKIARQRADEFDGNVHITAHSSLAEGWPTLVKRAVDIIFSSALLVVLSPLLLTAAVLIKLTSKGPVLFLQQRVGLHRRRFNIYKFRTMVTNAEELMPNLEKLNEAAGPVFKIKHDPRITPLGKWLRRSSIDELPQLFNVLTGDMSLVGPRPLPLRDYEGFNEDWQRRRFSVRPGITCLWQVNGRSNISFDHWMKLDLQYLDEWSLWLDAKILAQTIPAVMKGSGAA